MENNTKKEITLDDLALMMQEGFKKAEKTTETKIENLARLVVERFDEVDKRFDEVEIKLGNIEADLNKKVDVIKHNDLTYRVEKLEKHVGLAAA